MSPLPQQAALPFTLHLGVFVEPYLQFILEGKKTIESRFATRRFAPYNQVEKGDVILLKQSSGPIVGICQVTHCWFYELDPESWETIQRDFAQALCAQDPEFWQQRQAASYATLMRVQFVKAIEPIPFAKRDRRGWVILQPGGDQQLNLEI
ncbi:MAG: ASCH domain-containing protein [Leptolyngbya sp. UWPOB_LEPTO1]|uniref:ASCH domain-containing protein n=1 Tax=Leptolyngbya sp. UWPOB_LEPTO1 TaxID=2815653 RepID=UPI001ACEB51A|nr:ASCH domain-containing protein [Leptolyngbya sp. UWPOB_LEPTO1]MBN8564807.1 ASCH domain-containing protein [Leptolyngbya sp. UWPOB_LEPTO1]